MVVVERPFTSKLPVVGKAVAWLRTMWGNVAMRHYVRALGQQQNEFNQLVTSYINQHQTKLMQQDSNGIEMIQTLANLRTQITEINEQLEAVEDRLARLIQRK